MSKPESPATQLARQRWKNITKEERTAYARMMLRARYGEKPMCACGCGLTLDRAMKRHPKRAKRPLPE